MRKLHPNTLILLSAVAGLSIGFSQQPTLILIADSIVEIFMRLLKLISTPLIFMAVLSTMTGMGNLNTAKKMGGTLLKYTLITTITAAAIALVIYLLLNPASHMKVIQTPEATDITQVNYLTHLFNLIPDNIVQVFLKGNPVSILFLAFLIGISILLLSEQQRNKTHEAMTIAFSVIMNITRLLLKLLPLVIFGFFAQFAASFPDKEQITGLALFLLCILSANLIQAFLVLPLLLWWKGLSPKHIFQGMRPALLLAFLSKSSSAALPLAIENAEKHLKIEPRISRFILPLCITVNMNACAAFILITTLFVSMSNGMTFTGWELIGWIFLATIAAVGNAGVPMGCFMLSSAILASMGIPLQIMGVILPFYAIIDMLESGINVWSDACVTAVVAKDHNAIITSSSQKSAHVAID